jgi:hypothetical protein
VLNIFHGSLKIDGKVIITEENGNNIINRFLFFIKRGNKRVISIYDKKLQKHVLYGNENVRSLEKWKELFENNKFIINTESIKYLRYYLPYFYNSKNADELLKKEIAIQNTSIFRKNYLFWGLNFVAKKID